MRKKQAKENERRNELETHFGVKVGDECKLLAFVCSDRCLPRHFNPFPLSTRVFILCLDLYV